MRGYCSEAQEVFDELGYEKGHAMVNFFLGYKAWEENDNEQAIRLMKSALAYRLKSGERTVQYYIYYYLAQAYEEAGRISEALPCYKNFLLLDQEFIGKDVQRKLLAFQARPHSLQISQGNDKEASSLATDYPETTQNLASMSLKVIRKDKLLHNLRQRLLDLKTVRGSTIKSLIREIDANLEQVDAWEIFEQQLQSLDPDFLHGLTEKCPSLTPAEIRLCSLLRINMSNKDIAALLSISDRTVDTHRTRIRKKLGLKKEESLVGELARI